MKSGHRRSCGRIELTSRTSHHDYVSGHKSGGFRPFWMHNRNPHQLPGTLWVFLELCAKKKASPFAPTCSIKGDFEKKRTKCGWGRNDRESDVYDPKIPCVEACNPGEAARDDQCGRELAGLYGRP